MHQPALPSRWIGIDIGLKNTEYNLAWLPQGEAIANLLGHIPGPNEEIATHVAAWDAARSSRQTREPYRLLTPSLEELPAPLTEIGKHFKQRPDVISSFQNLDWTIGLVNLENVLSFQKIVVEDQAVERVAGASADDARTLFSLCLPEPPGPVRLPAIVDPHQKALTFSSLNPNLRVGPYIVQEMNISPAPSQVGQAMKFAGFAINFGSPFVQVAEYKSRWFVRDGYHRCYGFLRRGIRKIPCVFIRARSFQELGAEAPGFFSHELLFGERPPFLSDFLNDSVSVFAHQEVIRKVIRVSAEEFVVQV